MAGEREPSERGQSRLGRHRARRTVAIAASAVLATVGGVVWAQGGAQAKPPETAHRIEIAKTYEVVLPGTGGEEHVDWTIGSVTFEAMAGSGPDPNTGGISFGTGRGFTNNGPGPVAVVWSPGQRSEDGQTQPLQQLTTWAEAGEGGGDGGEVYNTGDYPVERARMTEVFPVAILDEGGVSASGFFAMSFRYDAADQTGHYVFTLQVTGSRNAG